MSDFFTRHELDSFASVESAKIEEPQCLQCGLYKNLKYPKMSYTGNGRKNCLIIAEAPAREEDAEGIQLIGEVGQYFRRKLRNYNLDLDEDFYKINAVNCWPRDYTGSTRTPTKSETEFCKPLVDKVIEELKPRYIWLMGGAAIESFYLREFKRVQPTRWRGLCIPDQKTNAWVFPLFHPSYSMRTENKDLNLVAQYDRDLKQAVEHLNYQQDVPSLQQERIHCLYSFIDVKKLLENFILNPPKFLYIDFETTGIKPYRAGHKIVCVSLCCSMNEVYSFPLLYRDHWTPKEYTQIKDKIRKILFTKEIKKQAHNLKFENIWAKEILNINTQPWDWCSMTASHILDNRRAFTSLKFQNYINFGILPYDKRISKYLETTDKEGFNKVEEVPLDELLEYCGKDSLYGFRLTLKQKQEFKKRKGKLINAYRFFHKGLIEFAHIENTGINVDEEYYEKTDKDLKERIESLKNKLLQGEEAKRFEKKKYRKIDLNSNKDLGTLIYDVLKADPVRTAKNNYSVNEDALKRSKLPFVSALLKLRSLEQTKNTFLSQFRRFAVNGKIHPTIDLHLTVSYRSASSQPNIQNIPVREEEIKNYCRKGVIPSKGNKFVESDFSGVEVCTSVCYHKDPNMIKYITDPKSDMHRDSAMDIWILPIEEITKDIRFYAKNDWTFAEFYGSYYKDCAKSLWEDCARLKTVSGVSVRQHLRDVKIRTLGDFTDHCQDVERKFWDVKFKVYKKWKEENNNLYRKQGYLESYMGFVYSGPMSFNEVCNYQIQGTAFHLLLWTMLELAKIRKEEKWKSKVIEETHDSMLHDTPPEEEEHLIKTINYIGTEKIREAFPWIIVPLSIEHESSLVDGSWAEMSKGYIEEKRPARRTTTNKRG